MHYQHLLVAVDAADDRDALLAKAASLARTFGARLSVISVVTPLPINTLSVDPGMTMPIAMEPAWSDEMQAELSRSLVTASAPLGIAAQDVHLMVGNPDRSIVETAKQVAADLILIGHRQHRGFLASLFAHTDQSVVGKAPCDVLAVVLPQAKSSRSAQRGLG